MTGEKSSAKDDEKRPFLRVVRGTPDDEELAALTAALVAVSAATAQQKDKPAARSAWADVEPRLRQPLRPGPGAWRASARLR
ncbi:MULTISPECIES: acyl-CoA carboxylase subunit epsilon [Actinomycetes]|jgi:hypothetical protein|uniref:Acyl-CoA carboxylase subunit epsilon n=1 Tax=Thermocrispum agreste TaxID=37925 RepID=A0A2W4JQ60_9PSEU|nr:MULTISPECIES: acyl-CoA carboxylase subunit epsilon [Actinomycetes]PZN01111.1 MAG: acyl-CoA carboxylase subunit epsilon [Thermocrispum agreste]HLV54613.1 acyl-CoA carboxylase subunit epsilon [Actinotalea caeni]